MKKSSKNLILFFLILPIIAMFFLLAIGSGPLSLSVGLFSSFGVALVIRDKREQQKETIQQ